MNSITNGPYAVSKESVAGFIIILAKDMDDAVSIAQKYPTLEGDSSNNQTTEQKLNLANNK